MSIDTDYTEIDKSEKRTCEQWKTWSLTNNQRKLVYKYFVIEF